MPIMGLFMHNRVTRIAAFGLLALAEIAFVPSNGFAQDDAPAADPAPAASTEEVSSLAWFAKSEGFFLFPQLAIGIAIVAMIGTGVFFSLRSRFINDGFVANFEAMVKNRQFKEAFEAAKADPTILGKVLSAGMARLTDGHADAIQAMQETGASENMKIEHRLSYLGMLANIATLVGLLGTVAGMVASFMVLATSDVSPSPTELAKGVSQALVTTIVGLIESIPAIMGYTILGNLNSRRITEVGIISDNLMRPFKQVAVARKPAAAPAAPPQPAAAVPAPTPPSA